MSWYNNQSQGFIDATQELNIGGGEVIENYYTEASDVFIPKVLDEQNGSTDTLIVNNTANSRIFIKNSNTTPKIRIEDGKLYLYYTYDFTNAPTITSGWIDVDNYITAIKQAVLILDANSVAIDTLLLAPVTGLKPRFEIVEPLTISTATQVTQHEARITQLEDNYLNSFDEEDFFAYHRELADRLDQELKNFRDVVSQYSDQMSQLIQTAANYTNQSRVFEVARFLYNSKNALFTGYLQNILFGLGGVGVIIGVISQVYDIITSRDKETQQLKLLTLYEKVKNEPLANELKFIHLNGLTIIESTNNNFSTSGSYTITLPNQGKLSIQVKVVNSQLKAFILKVKEEGVAYYNVNDIINIPKSNLGGTTGNLQIQVTSLISEVQIISSLINELNEDLNITQNRRRLRDGIIKKDEFGDGLSVVYNTSVTNAETGETLQVPTIKLNLNTAQMETINGVLNIIKYVNTDTTDIINANLDKVYKLLLPTGATLTSDYKLNLGYKEYYSGYAYDLIMMAIKKDTYSTFTPSVYNNDYLGYFPNMGRLANVGDVKVSYTNGLLVNTSQHFTKGLIYFKNTNATKTFNMNRKFEFVTFLKFVSFNNNTTDYHLLQTGKEGLMEIDDKKLSVYIRDRKIKVQHPALVSYNIFTNGVNSVKRLTNSQSYQVREPFASLNDNIILEAENLNFANYKYRYRMLNVPYLINNESQYINTPTGFLKITDDLPNTFQANEDTKFISLYLNHPSNPNQPIADCIWPSVDYLMGINDNGTVMTEAQFTVPWYIKRMVLRFDVLLHRITDENPPEGGQTYIPWPVLYQETNQATLCTRVNYALSFRIVYSYDGINLINHDFTIYDVFNQGGFVNTGKTVRTGWYNNMLLPKKYLTYTFEIPNTYPNYGQKVRIVKLEIIKKTGLTYYPANASASIPYTNQPVIFLYEFNAQEYGLYETGTTQVIYDKYVTTDSLTTLTNVNLNQQYLTTLQLDLPNNSIKYGLDTTSYTLSNRSSVKIYAGEQVDIPMPHPNIPFVTANFVSWAKLTNDNSTLVVGNNPTEGEIDFTHFNWRFFQNTEAFLTTPEIIKMMPLISFYYYYDYVKVDKLLGTNEIFANSINTDRLMIGSNVITTNLSAAQRAISLRTNQTQDVGNLLIDITKFYVANPTVSGSLTYNHTTKTFGIGASAGGVGTRSEEDAITLGLIKDAAGFALQWNNVNKTLNVIPENIWQDLSPYATTTYVNTKDAYVSNYVWESSNFLQTQINNILPYDDAYISNYVLITSNVLFDNYVAKDGLLDTKINNNDLYVSNYILITSNVLFTDYVARDGLLDTKINNNDLYVSNYVKTTSNILFTDYVARNGLLDTKINNNDLYVSNYVRATSNILFTDYVARDQVLNTAINTNAYSDTKVSTYLTGSLSFYGNVLGNTGIGTATPQRSLHLHKEQASAFVATKYTNITTTGGLLRGFDVGMDGSQQAMLQNYENTAMYFATNGSTRLLIQADGKIGIGTNSVPEATLHLHKPTVNTDCRITFTDSTTTTAIGRGVILGKLADQRGFFYNYENQPLFFGTNSVERMRIMASGDVGIGTDSVPFARLHLHRAGASQDSRIQFTDTTTGVTGNDGVIVGKLADGRGFLYNYEANGLFFGTNSVERMTILSNGRIGIGTGTPQYNLHIHDNTTSADVRIQLSDLTSTASNARGFHIFKSNINFANIINYESTNLQLGTAGVIRMYIGSTGNVGIGNTAGAANKLDVFGNVNTNSAYLINNTDIFTTIKALSYFKQTAASSILQGGGFYITTFDILINNRWNEVPTAGTNCRWTFKAQLATTNITDSAKYVFANVFFDTISNTNFNHIQNMVGTWTFSIVQVTTDYYLRVQVQTAVSQSLLNVNII